MQGTEYTLPRRPAAPQARGLGTPVTSLPGATRVDEVPTPAPPADADAPPPPDIEVVEDEALENFAQMAQRLMREPGRKRPQGMPERKSRVVK